MQFLSVNEMNQLRCKNCNNFLSCGPMVVWKEGSTLCGRCISAKHAKCAPAVTFEQVIKTIRVPCRYWFRYCKELLYPDEVPLHEQACMYKSRAQLLCGDFSAALKMSKSLPHSKEPTKLLNLPRLALDWLLCAKCSLYLSAPGCYVNGQGRPFCFRCITNTPQMDYIRHVDLEKLLSFMVFPCIFHMRGCTKRYRFGDPAAYSHEQECPYGFAAQRPLSQLKTINVNGKQKGVIPTHTGHVFATITPNTIQLFANAGNWKDGQEKLMNNLQERVGNKTGEEPTHEQLLDSNGPHQILDVSKLETNQFRPRLDEVRNSFRQNAPAPLTLPPQDPELRNFTMEEDNSIMNRSKDSPKRTSMMYNSESIPISPVFVQPQPSNYYPPNSLPRRDSDISAASLKAVQKRSSSAVPPILPPPIIENQVQNHSFPSPNVQSTNLRQGEISLRQNSDLINHRPQSHPIGRTTAPPPMLRMASAPRMMTDSEEPQSDEFQAYGLPYGNTNLTHGVQPNVFGKEVTLERVPSVLQYNSIVTELKIKQKIKDMEGGDEQ